MDQQLAGPDGSVSADEWSRRMDRAPATVDVALVRPQ